MKLKSEPLFKVLAASMRRRRLLDLMARSELRFQTR
jgi:hypothetical protein